MRRSDLVLALFLTLPLAAPAWAAEPPADPGLAAMQALQPWVGRWQGTGSLRRGAGEPERFAGEEVIEARLDGHVLLIEGTHWTPDHARLVHHALALLSFDSKAGAYRFRSFLADGSEGEFAFRAENGVYRWTIESPQGAIEYRIEIAGDRWHEVGTIQRDGRSVPFFEMEMQRTGG